VLIPGDGIGPEVTRAAQDVITAAGVGLDWVVAPAGLAATEQFGDPLPESTLDLIRKHRVALKGPCTTPVGKGYRSINVRLRQSDGLFLDCARLVADEFPFIDFEERRIVNLCMELVLHPERFDVLVMENLFGDVISDLCAGLVGGLGLVPGSNVGARFAVFEAVHGSAPDIAGKGLANPIAVVRSAAMMLDHVGKRDAARRIEAAVLRTL